MSEQNPGNRQPIALKGKGTRTERIDLAAGLWTAAIQVVGNHDGYGNPPVISVEVDSMTGGRQALLVSVIGEGWEGSVIVRVGGSDLSLAPGPQIVSVKAVGTWTIQFTQE